MSSTERPLSTSEEYATMFDEPVPRAVLKFAPHLETLRPLMAALKEAMRKGQPITDWTPYTSPWLASSEATPQEASSDDSKPE